MTEPIELTQTRTQALLARLYWRDPEVDRTACGNCGGDGGRACGNPPGGAACSCRVCEVCEGTGTLPVWEMRPRRYAALLRPLMGFEPLEA